MSETTMPAAETNEELFADERNSYEFAFHVLPTVAEGEVSGVFEELKALITKTGGEIFSEEAPERIDLAYTIVQSIQGKHRKYASAYFGWIRFRLNAELMSALTEEIDVQQALLRHLIIKLTKADEENPYRFHENRKSQKMVEVVNEDAKTTKAPEKAVTEEKKEEKEEVVAEETKETEEKKETTEETETSEEETKA